MDISDQPRGIDFANKFAKGEWAETVLLETIEQEEDIFAFQYGVSRGDALETKEELDNVKEPDVEEIKRPDILIYEEERLNELAEDTQKLITDYISADPDARAEILPQLEGTEAPKAATMALECESSKFNKGERSYNKSLSAYVKDEDYPRLLSWRDQWEVPIFVCQLFFDKGYIIRFADYEKYADEAKNGTPSVTGFEHGSIPNISKIGLQARVDDFPPSMFLGSFTEEPSVVRKINDDVEDTEFSWSRSGKLEAAGSAFFSGGTFLLYNALIDYL
jgi:hypothetical protein